MRLFVVFCFFLFPELSALSFFEEVNKTHIHIKYHKNRTGAAPCGDAHIAWPAPTMQDVCIVQIACGDAHTVALSREGLLYSPDSPAVARWRWVAPARSGMVASCGFNPHCSCGFM